MSVIETRAKVSIIDGATSGLKNIANATDRMTASLSKSGKSAKDFSVNMKSFTTSSGSTKSIDAVTESFNKSANSISNMNKMVNRLIYSVMRYTVIYEGIQKLGDLWGTVVGGAYEYGNMIETNRVGMAGILSSMMQINGQQLSWNQSLQISSKIMQDLQNESLKTSATANELIDTFRALLGPGLGAGMTIEQIEKFTTVGVNAVKSLGLDGVQLVQELRDMVQGGIRPASSTLATALGITDADIKKAKASSEGLYKFLMDRMKGFEYSALETNNTVKGRLDQIKEGLQRGIAEGTEPLREIYSNTLKEFGNSVVQVNTATKEWKINPAFTESLTSVSNKMIDIGKQAKDVGELLWPTGKAIGGTILTGLDTLSNHIGMIAGLWATIKISKYAKDFMQILTLSREERDLQTSFGRFWQGLNDKVSGYAEKQKQALAIQKEREAWQEKENALIDNAILTYDKMVSGISASANEARTLNAMVQSNENSVTNLAEKWQKMGMSAKEAIATQNKIVWLTNNGYTLEAMNQVRSGNARADEIQQSINKLKEQEEQQRHAIELYKQQKKAIDDVVASEHERQMQVKNTAKDELNEIAAIAKKVNMRGDKTDRARFNVDSFLSVDTSNGAVKTKERTIYAWQQEQVAKLRDELHKLKLSEEVVQQTTEKFMDSLKSGMKDKIAPVFEQAINSAKVWQTTINASLEKIARMSNEEINYHKFMNSGMLTQNLGKPISDSLKGFAATTLNAAEAEFKKVGMAADEAKQKAFEFTNYFIQGLKSIDASNLISVQNLMKQIVESASQYADKFKLVKEQVEAVKKANAEATLEFNALSNAFKVGGEEAYQATKRVLEESKQLQAALSERGAVDQANAVYKELINYLNEVARAKEKVVAATQEEMQATKEATDTLKNHTKAVEDNNEKKLTMNQRLGKTTGIVSAASLNFSIMSDIVAANSKEDEEWAKSAADVAMQISMVSMGIGGLIDLFPSLIKGLKEAVKWFREFTLAKAIATVAAGGVGTLIAAGVAGIGYGAYQKWKSYSEGNLTLGNTFSDAEMGGFDAEAYKDVKIGKKWSVLPGEADMAEQAQQDKNWAIGNAARQATGTSKLIEQAKLSDLINKGAESSDGKSGTGSSKKELPALEYTDALGNAFWYLQHGYSVYAAAALAGNQMQEAGRGDTESIDYAADNKQGYYGSVQWGGDRFNKLVAFSNGDWTNKENQLAFSDYELSNDPYYKTIGDRLKAAGSLEEANHIVFSQYEAPGDDTEGTRLAYAQQLLPRLLALQNKEATLNGETGNGHISDLSRQREEQFKKLIDATNLTIRDTDNLNKMTLSVTGKQSAYDKTIQEANDKLSEYATQIVRDEQLGVDEETIQRLKQAMDDYADAMKQKAREARQTEIISRYDDRISAIQNRNLGFGEIGQQREDLTKEYSNLRDYLQEQLQSDSLTYDQRIKLEQKLASTIKSINEQSAYDYKTSWQQAMTEISNEQINWKDTWVSMMSSIESSMADALSSTGNFSSRMKSLFKGLAQSIVKSLSQIIAKLLITKMITSLFGGLSGGGSTSGAKVGDAWTGGLTDAINIRGASIDGFAATGGDVPGGSWYMVGERGPELVRFAKDAHVYKNADTMRMLSSKEQAQPVQIIVNNNTGTQMEARQSVSQDSTGKMLHQIILTTVGDALSTNEYGLRDAILGAR